MEEINRWVLQVNEQLSLQALRELRGRFHDWLFQERGRMSVIELSEVINQFHDRMIDIVSQLALQDHIGDGSGIPPVPYAFILFGSGGRREQTPWSDQDNGIIYQTPPHEQREAIQVYFMKLGERWSDYLCQVGYPPCVGNVICTNEKWCKDHLGWQQMIDEWWERQHWEDIRYLLITADARVIHGEEQLWAEIRSNYLMKVLQDPERLRVMLRNTLFHKVALGVFGQFLTERYGPDAGGVDIKYGGYIPMVNAFRLLAVQHGITASSTLERIDLLAGHFEEPQISAWRNAFLTMIYWRSNSSFVEEDGLYTSSGKLKVKTLSSLQKQQIKDAFRSGIKLQTWIEQRLRFRRE